jgi:putative SOS response-associated peptidase YedK
MAGIYNFYRDEMHYVILTTQANESVQEVHDRMPLVIPRQELAAWLMDQQAASELMRRIPPRLVKKNVKEDGYGYQYRMDLY